MQRAALTALALLTIGCSSEPLEVMDRQMTAAAATGEQDAVHRALCGFVGLDEGCVSQDGPVPPPPTTDRAGVLWAIYIPVEGDFEEDRFRAQGTFMTSDRIILGALTGILVTNTDQTEGHFLGDSETVDVEWHGVFTGDWFTDGLEDPTGVFQGGWARAEYTEVADFSGTWLADEDRPGGRLVGSFDFDDNGMDEEYGEDESEGEEPAEDPLGDTF